MVRVPVLCSAAFGICVLAFVPSGAVAATNLVVNGSFEADPLASGAYRDILVGDNSLTGWTIVGVPNTHISQVHKAYAGNPGYSFPAQDGNLFVDLAGYSDNAADGIQQTVATAIGSTYDFSFWLGNITGPYFGTQSLVDVAFSSGGNNFSCVNTISTTTVAWQQCTQTFTATSDSTTFTITNRDPQSDYSSLIDNVSLSLAGPSAVPEPATWILQIAGFGLLGALVRRRRKRTAGFSATRHTNPRLRVEAL